MQNHKKSFSESIFIILLFALFSIYFQSCSSFTGVRRGKLSDAMDKASDEHEGDRTVDTDFEPGDYYYEYEETTGTEETTDDFEAKIDSSIEKMGLTYSFMGGPGLIKGDDFFGLNHFNASIGTYLGEYHRLELFAGFAWAPVQKTSKLNKSLESGVLMLNAGINYKLFLTPKHTFLGQYVMLGAAYNKMFWSYKNSLQDEYGDIIGADGLDGIEIFTGIGLHLIQTKIFQIGGEIVPGIVIWGWLTDEGFDNDVFSPFWEIKFRVTGTYMHR
jgi:hypothetical protein